MNRIGLRLGEGGSYARTTLSIPDMNDFRILTFMNITLNESV
jgi:hypothetical protein